MRFRRFSVFLLLLVLSACTSSRETEETRPKKILRIAFPSTVRSLDPYTEATQISGSIFNRVFDALARHTHDMQLQPSLATQWSNPDEKTWVFELRHDVKFHDGTPLTAEDVKFSLETLKKSTSNVQASALTVLDRVEVVDAYTVRMIMHEPASNFVRRLAAIAIVSRKSYKAGSTDILPGTGPFRVKNWAPGKSIQLEASRNYWGAAPHMDEVRFEASPNSDASMDRLLKGEIDVIPLLEPGTVARFKLESRNDVALRNYPGLLVLYLGFNTRSGPLPESSLTANPFQDIRVRRAVYQAIHTEHLILNIQRGYAEEATQLVSPIVYGYNNSIRRLPYDPQTARQLLAEAGFPKGFDVRLDIPSDRYRAGLEIGEAIAKDLAAVGIKVQINARPKEEWMKIRMEGRTPFYLAGWVVTSGDASGALDYIAHTPGAASGYGRTNSGGYSNPEVDRIIEKASRTTGARERLVLLEQAMDLVMKDFAVVPLYVEQNLAASRPNLEWTPRADGLVDPTTFAWK